MAKTPVPETDDVKLPEEDVEAEAEQPDDQAEEVVEPKPEPVKPKKIAAGSKATARPAKSKKKKDQPVPAEEAGESEEPEQPAEPGDSKKKKLALILSLAGVVLIGAAAAGYVMFSRQPSNPPPTTTNNTDQNTNVSNLIPRRIDGVMDEPQNQNRYPVGVMVENQVDARPQSGLDEANVIYEALAEGGITRFLAIYTFPTNVEEIGPVRSARPYYVDWARGYKALYVHAGGSPKGLARISAVGLPDLNQFFNSQYFYRDRSRRVASEHTLYTSSKLLLRALVDKKMPQTATYDAWSFKPDAAAVERPASQHVTIDFSSFSYKVDYEYDPATNEYVRMMGEKAHVTRSGVPIRPKNVVVINLARRLEGGADNHGRLTMDTIGSGKARFFIDGREFAGTWKKSSAESNIQLIAEDGSPMQLNAGQTWVEVVPPEQNVTVR